MSAEATQLFLAIAQTIVALATFVLALVVLKVTKQIARADYARTMQDTWNMVNSVALSNDDLLKVADQLNNLNAEGANLDSSRKKWFAFILLNAFQATFLGMENGLLDKEYAKQTLEQLLPPLLEDSVMFRLTQESGYHPRFTKYCKERQQTMLLEANALKQNKE